MTTLHDLVYCHIEEFSKNVAVTYDDGEGKKHVITYSELYQVSRKVTNILRSCNAENEIVGVCIQTSEDIPAILLGILPVPAAFYFFEPNPVELISQALQKLSVGILIVDIRYLKDLECLLQTLGGERSHELLEFKLIIIKLNRITRKKNSSDLAYCIATSGSTGTPKMVQVPHKCIIPNITYLRDQYGVTSDDVLFLAAPLTFDPSIIDIFLSLSSGARLLITSQHIKVQPMKLSKMLHDFYHITILQVTPSLIFSFGTKLLKETILSKMSSLRILAMGGEKFPPIEVIKLWRADGNRTMFYNLYGLTEVSCWSSCYEVIEEDFGSNADIPIGNAMYGTSLVVFDEHSQTVTNGFGWLHTGGLHRVCQINECTPCDNLYNTGDWVSVNEFGQIFYIQRKDEQIKRAGKRLNLQEIDSVMLKELSFIDNCKAVFSEGRLILLYKLSDEKIINKTITEEKMKQTLKKFLPSYYQPDYLVKVDFFPLNHHGKLNVSPLIEMLKENIVKHNSVEEVFMESWKISLNLSEGTSIEPSANFVAGGGDSLMAVHFIDQLELNLGIKLSSLIHSVLYNSYNETLGKLKELIYNHEGKVPIQVLAKHKEGMRNEITMKEDMKKELKREGLLNSDVSVMENYYADTEEEEGGLINEIKTHLNKNETSINEYQTLKSDSLCPGPSKSDSIKESTSSGSLFGSNNAVSAEKRTMFKNEYQVPPKLIKKKESKEHESRIGRNDKELSFVDKSQAICSHKRKMVDVLWSFNTGKCVDASAVISSSSDNGGVVFIGSHSHRFYALSEKNGQLLWEVIFGDRIESSACLSQCQKYVIVGCYDSCVYILKVKTGEIHWKFKTGDVVKCSPVVDPLTSLIWIGSHDECIYSLDIKSRTNKIKKNLQTGSIFSSPSICTNPHQVYISTLGGYLYSMDPFDGSIKWKEDFGKPLFTSPCITSNGVVVGCVDGNLYALDHAGNQTWKLDTDGQIFSSPICMLQNREKDEEIIVCGSYSHFIFCCFINGNLKWKTNIHSKIYAAPYSNTDFQESDVNSGQSTNEYSASASNSRNQFDMKLNNGFIAVCSTDGNLKMLCVKCGFIICEFKLPGEVFSSPVVCGEKIFLGCRDDKVYCLKIADF